MNTNPRRGQFHFRAPGKMFWHTVRGMIPHTSARGAAALARLATFEGVPEEFCNTKKKVVPDALKVLHSKTIRKTTQLGDLASECGWKHKELIKKLELARAVKGAAYHAAKKEEAKLVAKASEACSDINGVLAGFGYYVEPTAAGAMKALKEEFKSALPEKYVAGGDEAEVEAE